MVDCENFTYLILIVNKKVKDFRFLNRTEHHFIVDGAVSSNPLIVRNNPFGINDPFTEKKQLVDLHKQKLETVPESNFK